MVLSESLSCSGFNRRDNKIRCYPLLLILLLSFMMPPQLMGEILQSLSSCHEEMAMADSAGSEVMPCCLDIDQGSPAPCKMLKTCHLCQTPGQLYLPAIIIFAFLAGFALLPKPLLPIPIAFNPASIWRPPSIS